MYTYIEGKPVEKHYLVDDLNNILFEYGKTIAKIHQGLKHCDEIVCVKESQYLQYVLMNMDEVPLSDAIKAYFRQFEELYPLLPTLLIHRDLHPNNMIMNNRDVVGVIDFEIFSRGIRILDICYCGTALLSEAYPDLDKLTKWLNAIASLFSGYDQISILTSYEKESMVLCMMIIQFIFVVYFKDNNEKLAQLNLEILNWIYENRKHILQPLTL